MWLIRYKKRIDGESLNGEGLKSRLFIILSRFTLCVVFCVITVFYIMTIVFIFVISIAYLCLKKAER